MEIGFSKKKSTKAQKNVRNDEIFEFPALLEGKMIKKTRENSSFRNPYGEW